MTGAVLDPASHPDKDIREVLKTLVRAGWTLHKGGHWGWLYCPCPDTCLKITVGGSPPNVGRAVRRIKNEARKCPLPVGDPRRPPRTGVVV